MMCNGHVIFFFFSSRRRHTRFDCDWSSDVCSSDLPRAEGPHIVSPPQVGDGRLWVSPRPALPTEVADVLYEPQESRDTTVVHRLRAMVDSLNVVIDQDQRSRQRDRKSTRLNSSHSQISYAVF